MVTQVEYEVYALHHRQQLMQKAQTSRTINKMRSRNSKRNFGVKPLFSRLRSYALKKNFGHQVQSTKKAETDKELISG